MKEGWPGRIWTRIAVFFLFASDLVLVAAFLTLVVGAFMGTCIPKIPG